MTLGILYVVFITATILFSLLLLRVVIALFALDPYHPAVKFVMRLTEPLVRPFRFGPFLRPARVDPAIIVPLFVLFLVLSYAALVLFAGGNGQ